MRLRVCRSVPLRRVRPRVTACAPRAARRRRRTAAAMEVTGAISSGALVSRDLSVHHAKKAATYAAWLTADRRALLASRDDSRLVPLLGTTHNDMLSRATSRRADEAISRGADAAAELFSRPSSRGSFAWTAGTPVAELLASRGLSLNQNRRSRSVERTRSQLLDGTAAAFADNVGAAAAWYVPPPSRGWGLATRASAAADEAAKRAERTSIGARKRAALVIPGEGEGAAALSVGAGLAQPHEQRERSSVRAGASPRSPSPGPPSINSSTSSSAAEFAFTAFSSTVAADTSVGTPSARPPLRSRRSASSSASRLRTRDFLVRLGEDREGAAVNESVVPVVFVPDEYGLPARDAAATRAASRERGPSRASPFRPATLLPTLPRSPPRNDWAPELSATIPGAADAARTFRDRDFPAELGPAAPVTGYLGAATRRAFRAGGALDEKATARVEAEAHARRGARGEHPFESSKQVRSNALGGEPWVQPWTALQVHGVGELTKVDNIARAGAIARPYMVIPRHCDALNVDVTTPWAAWKTPIIVPPPPMSPFRASAAAAASPSHRLPSTTDSPRWVDPPLTTPLEAPLASLTSANPADSAFPEQQPAAPPSPTLDDSAESSAFAQPPPLNLSSIENESSGGGGGGGQPLRVSSARRRSTLSPRSPHAPGLPRLASPGRLRTAGARVRVSTAHAIDVAEFARTGVDALHEASKAAAPTGLPPVMSAQSSRWEGPWQGGQVVYSDFPSSPYRDGRALYRRAHEGAEPPASRGGDGVTSARATVVFSTTMSPLASPRSRSTVSPRTAALCRLPTGGRAAALAIPSPREVFESVAGPAATAARFGNTPSASPPPLGSLEATLAAREATRTLAMALHPGAAGFVPLAHARADRASASNDFASSIPPSPRSPTRRRV